MSSACDVRTGTWKNVSLQDEGYGEVTEYVWIEYRLAGKTHQRLVNNAICECGDTIPVYLFKVGETNENVWLGVICLECRQCKMVRTLPEEHLGEKRALAKVMQKLGYLADYPRLTDSLPDIGGQKKLKQPSISTNAQGDFTHKPQEKKRKTTSPKKMGKRSKASSVKTL